MRALLDYELISISEQVHQSLSKMYLYSKQEHVTFITGKDKSSNKSG